tara:strand:+ start:571 stop:912 length:342 start_codon:yes stop_codon:yes gene_type:complete
MDNLAYKIRVYLGRAPNFETEVLLQDDYTDGVSNPYIKEWNITSEKAKPTDSQLNALASQATALENNAKADAKRRTEYLSWQQQFEMIYKDQKNGTTTYKDHCDKVRSDNPKE